METYTGKSLIFGAASPVSVPFEPDSLKIANSDTVEELRSGGALLPAFHAVLKKNPTLAFTLLDPTLVTDFEAVETGQTITSMTAIFQAYAANGGLAASFISFLSAKGVIMPVALNFAEAKATTLDVLYKPRFTAGVAWVIGTASTAGALVDVAYLPTSITIGASTITKIISGNINWEIDAKDEGELEPDEYYHDAFRRTGTVSVRDLTEIDIQRLEDGGVEAVSLLLTNVGSGGGTLTVNLADCYVRASIDGSSATIEFSEIDV